MTLAEIIAEPLGLVAGRGVFPFQVCRAARTAGVPRISVVAMYDETPAEIAQEVDHVDWGHVGQVGRAIKFLKRQNVRQVVFAGQIKPSRLYRGLRPDFRALKLLWRLRERNAESLFGAVADEFERCGIRVLSSATFMQDALAGPGQLGKVKPNRYMRSDIEFGTRIAREVSRLNIGQTVVVKKGTILAVEGFEGTDRAICRGGELGHGGVTVVKVAKPNHDLRFDIPCIGMRTVESLRIAQARTLAVQAGMTLILERDQVIAALDRAGIALIGIDMPGEQTAFLA